MVYLVTELVKYKIIAILLTKGLTLYHLMSLIVTNQTFPEEI